MTMNETALHESLRDCAVHDDVVTHDTTQARKIYESLNTLNTDPSAREASRQYLDKCLSQVSSMACDLPENENLLTEWMLERHEAVGYQYLEYLRQRESGAPRRYFTNRSHALYFLRGVAPTKLVDGSWLYGLLGQWSDDRYRGLIRIYLEELGEGVPAENHVAMYRRLLAENDCELTEPLDDELYVQGAVQLSLARNAAHFLPEIIGFNLGYEQLPLHLLITTYELKELGIDHYYFQVHVTVDNASTGHAHKALEAVRLLRPVVGSSPNYYERVRRGYLLNELGKGSVSIIDSFDQDAEMARIIAQKSVHGRHMHSDRAKVAGRTINDWLSNAADVPQFLQELQRSGWIKRHADPEQSRFWRQLSEGADMFGVFSGYERQLIHDWIWGDALPKSARGTRAGVGSHGHGLPKRMLRASKVSYDAGMATDAEGDFGTEMRDFEERLVQAADRHELMKRLAEMLDPAMHHTPPGLMATRMFGRLLDEA